MGRTRLSIRDLRRFVVASKATVSIAIVDACHSGTLVSNRTKGVRSGPAYDIRALSAEATARVKGHVIITSSGSEELSQETDRVRGSYFSHYVLSGLRGAADFSKDGNITLSELYHFAYSKTLSKTLRSKVGPQHPVREMRLNGTGEVTVTKLRRGHAAIRFPRGLHGTFYIAQKRGGAIKAEVTLSGKPVTIALPADTYLVRQRSKNNLRVSQMNLNWGGIRDFDPKTLRSYPLVRALPRGAQIDPSPYRALLSFEVRTAAADGAGPVSGLRLGVQRQLSWLLFGIDGYLGYSAFSAQDTSIRHLELATSTTLAALLFRGRLEGYVGLRAGAGYVLQHVQRAPNHGSWGGQLAAIAYLGWLLRDPMFVFFDLGIGINIFEQSVEGLQARPLIHGGLGLGFQF
jgi:hypothetical protein